MERGLTQSEACVSGSHSPGPAIELDLISEPVFPCTASGRAGGSCRCLACPVLSCPGSHWATRINWRVPVELVGLLVSCLNIRNCQDSKLLGENAIITSSKELPSAPHPPAKAHPVHEVLLSLCSERKKSYPRCRVVPTRGRHCA